MGAPFTDGEAGGGIIGALRFPLLARPRIDAPRSPVPCNVSLRPANFLLSLADGPDGGARVCGDEAVGVEACIAGPDGVLLRGPDGGGAAFDVWIASGAI